MRTFPVVIGAALLVACHKPAAESGAPAGSSAPAPSSSTHGAAKELGIVWTEPSGWKRVPPSSPMRNASYEVPAAEGDTEPGDLGVFYFGRDLGGAVERNIKRWLDSFEGLDESQVEKLDRSVNGLEQKIIQIKSGTYKSGMPGGPTTPKPGFALLGAIVVTPSGSHFFKLVGPKATVAKAHDGFMQLLDSVKPR